MKIAVSGARGFIGRHVLAELARHDIEVIATVGPSRALEDAQGKNRRWVALDLRKPPVDCYAALGRPDTLIHLAWAGLPHYRSLHHFESELPVQYAFLSGLVRQGLTALLGVGTCFEYGPRSGALQVDAETRPSNPYGFAKDALHKQLQFLQASHPFALTWARLFYLYGEGQSESSLFPQLKQAVSQGQRVFNMSGGEQLRDYLPVTEVARRLVELALARRDVGAINVCSGVPISVRRLVEGWIRENGWQIELNLGHHPYPDYEPMAFWGDPGEVGGRE